MTRTAERNATRNGGRSKKRSYHGALDNQRTPMDERRYLMYFSVLRNLEGLQEKREREERGEDFDWDLHNEAFNEDYKGKITLKYMAERLRILYGLEDRTEVQAAYNKNNRQATERSRRKQEKEFSFSSKGNGRNGLKDSYEEEYDEEYDD